MSVVENQSVQSKLSEANIAASKSPVATEAQLQQANNLAKNFASGGATLGETVAGFKSLSEEVKPALQERAEEFRKRVDPVVSEMQSDVPGVTVNSKPGSKSNVDSLAGKSTASEKKLRKVICGGNPKAINEVLRQEIKASEPAIKQATNKASEALKTPAVQEQFQSIGLSGDTLSNFNNLLDNQGVNSLMQNVETQKIADGLAQASQLQLKTLGNPFGSDLSSFGPKGLDFGNILGSVVGAITNTGPFQGVGQLLDALPGGINPVDNLPIPPVVDFGGNTNLAATVNKGNKLTDVTEPTTPVFDTSNSGGKKPLYVTDLQYEKVNGAKELELEMSSVDQFRQFETLSIGWIAKSGTDDNWTAREWNNYWVQAQRKKGRITEFQLEENLVGLRKGWQCNYFIRKDGTVERVLPIDTIPYNGNTIGGETFLDICAITLDAGLTVPRSEAGGQIAFLSADSITAEQWRSLDMFFKVFFRLPRAKRAIGLEELGGDIRYGPGFDVGDYVKKFRKQVPHQPTSKDVPAATAEPTPSNPNVKWDSDRRKYAVVVGGETQYYDTEPEAEAALTSNANSGEQVINGNKVYLDEVRGRWTVLFTGTNPTRQQFNSEAEAKAAAAAG